VKSRRWLRSFVLILAITTVVLALFAPATWAKGPPPDKGNPHGDPPGQQKDKDHGRPDHAGPPDDKGPPDHAGPPEDKGPPDDRGNSPPDGQNPPDHGNLPENPGSSDHKILICHVPPGNPANAHNVSVDRHAWETGHDHHNKHNLDYEGPCEGEPPPPPVCEDVDTHHGDWTCGEWGECLSGVQTRDCIQEVWTTDANDPSIVCSRREKKKTETQECGLGLAEVCLPLQIKVDNPMGRIVEFYWKEKNGQPVGPIAKDRYEEWVLFHLGKGEAIYIFDWEERTGWTLRASVTSPLCEPQGEVILNWENLYLSPPFPHGVEVHIYKPLPRYLGMGGGLTPY